MKEIALDGYATLETEDGSARIDVHRERGGKYSVMVTRSNEDAGVLDLDVDTSWKFDRYADAMKFARMKFSELTGGNLS
jgi:hypothetical protein